MPNYIPSWKKNFKDSAAAVEHAKQISCSMGSAAMVGYREDGPSGPRWQVILLSSMMAHCQAEALDNKSVFVNGERRA